MRNRDARSGPTPLGRGRAGWMITLGVLLVGSILGDRPTWAAPASPPVAVEDIRVGFEGRYKVGTWTPVWVLVRGGPDGFAGDMETIVEDESGTATVVRQPIQVGPGGTQRVTVYVRPGSRSTEFGTLRFVAGGSSRPVVAPLVIGDSSDQIPNPQPIRDVGFNDYQLVGLGHPQGLDQIPKLPGFNADYTAQTRTPNANQAREVSVALVNTLGAADQLPGRWYGYDSADAVVIDTSDAETLAALNGGRAEAIRQWVQRGGHLVLAVSNAWQAVNNGPLADLLPARAVGTTTVNPFDALESFTGGTHPIAAENRTVPVARLEDLGARGGRQVVGTASTPLIVEGPYGFGRVTLLTFDVNAQPFSGWEDRKLFWVKAIGLKAFASESADGSTGKSQSLMTTNVSDLATVLRRTLDEFQGMTVVPFGYVAGFIALYILLIGPGDYFFLKKVLKRMELTWITFPTIVVAVSLLAYYAAYRIKGVDLRVNQIDVVDVDQVQQIARGTSWLNLFSPQNRDYGIEVRPLPITANAAADAPPPPGTETLISWFAAPENSFMGMGRRGQGRALTGSHYTYGPPGRAERLDDVRIGIWSTKAVVARWFAPAPQAGALLDVDLRPEGTDRLTGTITNRLNIPLQETLVCFGKQVYFNIGTVAPGATVQLDTSLPRALSGLLGDDRPKFMATGQSAVNRAALTRELMFHESVASTQDPMPSRTHREVDLTGQLLLDRPMLVARIDRPGAVLDLANSPGKVVTDRTTVLRVILPLKGADQPTPPVATPPRSANP